MNTSFIKNLIEKGNVIHKKSNKGYDELTTFYVIKKEDKYYLCSYYGNSEDYEIKKEYELIDTSNYLENLYDKNNLAQMVLDEKYFMDDKNHKLFLFKDIFKIKLTNNFTKIFINLYSFFDKKYFEIEYTFETLLEYTNFISTVVSLTNNKVNIEKYIK